MHGDQLVPAVVAAVAVLCLLIAGRADGQDEYVPAAAASKEMEPLATNQNPRQVLPQPEVMPVPNKLLARPVAAGGSGEEYGPQTELMPGDALSRAFTGGDFPQQPTTEPEAETKAEPQPEQTTTREPEPVTPTRDQGDFYRTGATPTAPEPPATPTSPETWETPATPATPETPETPATPSVPVQQGYT